MRGEKLIGRWRTSEGRQGVQKLEKKEIKESNCVREERADRKMERIRTKEERNEKQCLCSVLA